MTGLRPIRPSQFHARPSRKSELGHLRCPTARSAPACAGSADKSGPDTRELSACREAVPGRSGRSADPRRKPQPLPCALLHSEGVRPREKYGLRRREPFARLPLTIGTRTNVTPLTSLSGCWVGVGRDRRCRRVALLNRRLIEFWSLPRSQSFHLRFRCAPQRVRDVTGDS